MQGAPWLLAHVGTGRGDLGCRAGGSAYRARFLHAGDLRSDSAASRSESGG